MRALRVLGTTDGGRTVLCDDPATGDQFAVAVDGTLRAALRGERPAPERSIVEPSLTPKEIQARIRAGASVEDLAAEAGTSLHRIERFAHAVLLERATVAEKARRAFPTVDGLPGSQPIDEVLATALTQRGLTGPVTWDAFRFSTTWVLQATWPVGHSTSRACWDFHPGPGGGTLVARDDTAAELVDPALRVLRPLRELKAVGAPDPLPALPTRSGEQGRSSAPAVRAGLPTRSAAPVPPPAAPTPRPAAPEPVVAPAPAAVEPTAPAAPVAPAEPAPASPAARSSRQGTSSRSGRRPAMPSWEDVLLGTRSKD